MEIGSYFVSARTNNGHHHHHLKKDAGLDLNFDKVTRPRFSSRVSRRLMRTLQIADDTTSNQTL